MNKYNAIKTIVDGIKFDSKLEAECYTILRDHITQLQPRFLLEQAFTHTGKKYRKMEYVADFIAVFNDKEYIIDVKGYPTPVFEMKHKLFLARNPDKQLLIIKDKSEALSLKLNPPQ